MSTSPQAEQLLRIESVSSRLGLRRTAIYELVRAKELKPPVKIGRASLWPASEIDAFIAQRIAARAGAR